LGRFEYDDPSSVGRRPPPDASARESFGWPRKILSGPRDGKASGRFAPVPI